MTTPITDWTSFSDLRNPHSFTYVDVAEALEGAADTIERDGWCRAVLYDGDAVCLRGALWKATKADIGGGLRPKGLMNVAEEALGYWLADRLGQRDPVHVPTWNDAECQDAEQAISVLRGCAAFVREGDE